MLFFLFIIYLKANDCLIDKCTYCPDDISKCEICVIGYSFNSITGRCEECENNCLKCYFENNKQYCTECKPGYNGFNYSNGGCIKCSENCYYCLDNGMGKGNLCIECNEGYKLVNNEKNCCLFNYSWSKKKQMCVLNLTDSDSYIFDSSFSDYNSFSNNTFLLFEQES